MVVIRKEDLTLDVSRATIKKAKEFLVNHIGEMTNRCDPFYYVDYTEDHVYCDLSSKERRVIEEFHTIVRPVDRDEIQEIVAIWGEGWQCFHTVEFKDSPVSDRDRIDVYVLYICLEDEDMALQCKLAMS
jgi:hypothetical protein